MEAWHIVTGALRLEPSAFEAIVRRPDGLRIALTVLLAAGFSVAIGQSIALFASRVRPWRFVASLGVGSLLFVGSVLIWGTATAVLSAVAFGEVAEPGWITRVVGLAHAPRLFGFLILTPYFGTLLGALLTVWTFLAVAIGVRTLFDLGLTEVVAVLGLAWLSIEVLSRTVGRPLVAVTRWMRRTTAGTPLRTLPLRSARAERRQEDDA